MPYTDTQRSEAVALYREHGTAEASRRTGIPTRTIKDWAKKAGAVAQANTEKTAEARAKAAERVSNSWADFREQEALAAGSTAAKLRGELRDRIDAGGEGRDLQAVATAYGILIDKAEALSGQATARIEIWAESELDRELRGLVAELEERVRE